MDLAKKSIKRPTFVIAMLVTVLVLGVIFLGKLSVRMFPDAEFPYVIVVTSYPGASVSEIEQLITKPVENAISGVSGLKHVQSINQDNMSIVFGEFELSKNPDIAAQGVRDKISQIRFALPEGIKEPIIIKADINNMPIVSLSVKSKSMTPKQLYDFADDVVSKDFAQIPGVSEVKIFGGLKREIHINVDMEKLRKHEFTLTSLAEKVKLNSLNVPAGKINRESQEVALRTVGEFKSLQQIDDVVISFIGNDRAITVKDVAKIEDSVEAETSRARINIKEHGVIISEPALLLNIYRQTKGNDVKVSYGINKKIAEVNEKYKQYPGSPSIAMISDVSRGVKMNIDDVKSTILEGIFLAVVIVYIFLGSWRSTFITALSLPNSLIGSFVFMYLFGFSLNVLSLMALSLAIGLLIDDAIVVRENIFRHYQKGLSPIKAAIDGTSEVALAVVATTSTVVAVFLPVAFLDGILGKFFREFGLTVVFAMIISIIDALTIAPMLSAYIIPEHNKKIAKKSKIQEKIIKFFRIITVDWFNVVFSFIEKFYKRVISFVVKEKLVNVEVGFFAKKKRHFVVSWKFTVLLIAMLMFIGTLVVAKKYLKITFIPASEWGEFVVNVQAKPGTSLDQMDKYVGQIEKIIISDPNVELAYAVIGSGGTMFSNLSSQASIYVKMVSAKSHKLFGKDNAISGFQKRTRTCSKMKDYLRKVLNENFGAELEFSIVRQSFNGSRSEFIMELMGDDIEVLSSVSEHLMKKYKTIPNFVDIHSNYKAGKPEVQIRMNTEKMKTFGVSSAVVGNEIRAMIDGTECAKYRENGLEYNIKVKLQENQKDIVKNFDAIYVSNVNNKLIKLKNFACAKYTSYPTQVFRKDRSRFVTIEGNLSAGGAIGEIQKEVLRIFNQEKTDSKNIEKWKNVKCKFSGNAEDMSSMFKSISIAGVLSMLFIFMILASLYESVITPFTIMTALPLAIIGGIIALLISGQTIDMFTLIGMIMLLGIVAKNSILLVDYIEQQLRNGFNINDAIIAAGTVRLRPILMTSFALVAGMLPTALGFSEVGQFRKGMGIVVIGGIISSTILTLIVVPAVFEYTERLRFFLRKVMGKSEKRMIDYTEEELKNKYLQ
jgi:HAE1 family hydrophobic/amphiphilic exporter-1